MTTIRKQGASDQAESRNGAQPYDRASRARKSFVEPAISSPVDVLAATTFFQVVDSGGTARRPARRD